MRICEVEGCERPYLSKGLCSPHYVRLRRIGDVQAEVPVREFDLTDKPTAEKKRVAGKRWYDDNASRKIASNRARQILKYERVAAIKLKSGCADCPPENSVAVCVFGF